MDFLVEAQVELDAKTILLMLEGCIFLDSIRWTIKAQTYDTLTDSTAKKKVV